MNKYADLHFHPGQSAFNKVRFTDEEKDPGKYHPWNIPNSKLKKQKKGKQAFKYTQCDFAKCTESGVKLAFASLYPIEKGFFLGKGGEILMHLTRKKKENKGKFNFIQLIQSVLLKTSFPFPAISSGIKKYPVRGLP